MTGCSVCKTRAEMMSGMMHIAVGAAVSFTDSTFSQSRAGANCGGISTYGSLTMSGCSAVDLRSTGSDPGSTGFGGFLNIYAPGLAQLDDCTVSRCSAGTRGGGIRPNLSLIHI